MSNISISNLNPTGSELFIDDESFMADLSDQEAGNIGGGFLADFQEISPISPGTPRVYQSPAQYVAVQNIAKVAAYEAYAR